MTDDDPFHATKTQPQSRSQTSQDHSCPPMLHDGIEVEVDSSDDDCHNSGSHDEQNCDSSYSESDSGDNSVPHSDDDEPDQESANVDEIPVKQQWTGVIQFKILTTLPILFS